MIIRAHNLPAGRTPVREGRIAMRRTLSGADIVLWEELEELTGVLEDMRTHKHIIGLSMAEKMRPTSYNPTTMRHLFSVHLPVGTKGWPKSVANFRKLIVAEGFEHKATGRKVVTFNVHMPHKALNGVRAIAYRIMVLALLMLAKTFHKLGYEVVFGGDWNARFTHRLVKPLTEQMRLVTPGGTHKNRSGNLVPIDYFFLLGAFPKGTRTLPKVVGDHLPIEVVI